MVCQKRKRSYRRRVYRRRVYRKTPYKRATVYGRRRRRYRVVATRTPVRGRTIAYGPPGAPFKKPKPDYWLFPDYDPKFDYRTGFN